ncbi:frizzled-4-like [Limulus polyphemus]|uniref:Frizzled-4-like n=1 Tax=Limulus polyphemus TaxID=6850 RepID=A0ABM1BZG7_LIMPO|nr:frizzled-4-like [Limulus polyphemus]
MTLPTLDTRRQLPLTASVFLCLAVLTAYGYPPTRTCEPIRSDLCKGLGYNETGMPNLVRSELQSEAVLQLQTFVPLIQYGCSSQLRFFLCSVYLPMCTEKVLETIGPCRPLCESVKSRCEQVMENFGFHWPASLNCSKFPLINNQDHMCMDGPEAKNYEKNHLLNSEFKGKVQAFSPSYTHPEISGGEKGTSIGPRSQHYGFCENYKMSHFYYYINRTRRCAQKCSADILFTHDNKNFTDIWVAVWASGCFLSTLFTVLTFLADTSKSRYPERAILYLSAAYNVYSIAYITPLVIHRDEIACHVDSQHGVSILIQEGLNNIHCTINFMLLYFFSMAGAVWWLILTVTWFLAAKLRWNHEAIMRQSTYFHLAAWALPSMKTIAILVMREVEADELTGTCYVGAHSGNTLIAFVIAPSFAYLLMGSVFLIYGTVSVFRSGSSHVSERLDVNTVRIGIFAVLYTIPATCVLGANFYEYFSREQWLVAGSGSRPMVEFFTLKIFMSLVVGMTTGLWVCSSKEPVTVWGKRWQSFTNRRRKNLPLTYGHHGFSQKHVIMNMSKRHPFKRGSETVV